LARQVKACGIEHRVKEEGEMADHNDHFQGHDEENADGPESGDLFAEIRKGVYGVCSSSMVASGEASLRHR
jgi:hypothetical protein